MDLDIDTIDIEDKLTSGSTLLTKKDINILINVIDEVDSLPCTDGLYDEFMEVETIEWLNNNEDFDLNNYMYNNF
jgi:hypothetical protein